MMAGIYNRVKNMVPGRSVFDLSYAKKFTCDMGQLIPVLLDEMVPGDHFTIGNQVLIRFQPLVAPIMHQINMYVHYFFVPYRLLWDQWEDFLTGGADGSSPAVMPEWDPTNTAIGSLWDFCGFPTGILPTGSLPIDFPRRAYNYVWNEYYRDETLQTEVALTNELIKLRNYEKDYFTSSLPFLQRGTAPALPITGTTNATWAGTDFLGTGGAGNVSVTGTVGENKIYAGSAAQRDNLFNLFNNNVVDLSAATTFDIADLRLAASIQQWLERNARAGARYTEFLRAHYNVAPRDERLQRPEYIGGSKSPVIISEVLQTSSTDATTPQGNLAGHGLTLAEGFAGKYFAEEFGLVIGLMSIMPRTGYSQGINKQWMRKTKYDFFAPEFANLSEQAVLNSEICCKNADAVHNQGIFGYQSRYDEMRTKSPMYCSQMRSTFDYWHLGREFDPAAPPQLNSSFIECNPRKDIFAVPAEPGLIVEFGNLIKAVRPLPIQAEPGISRL